jgi:cephalosporin hydroxylase
MDFKREVEERIEANGRNPELRASAHEFLKASIIPKYSYNFSWLGRPIIQYPQDIVAMQELVWEVQPDLIIETGIAHGGSLVFFSAMLELVRACTGNDGEVLGIDIDIREHNRKAIEAHPLSKRISMIEGSSIAPEIVAQVVRRAQGKQRVLISLDSNHTHDHVLAELEAYAHLTTVGSYCVVFDTMVNDMPKEQAGDRPWGPDNNPKTAVRQWLQGHPEFAIDKAMDHKLLVSVAPDGYLKRLR